MEIDEIRQKVDAALVGSSDYDDSVSRLENIGMSTRDAMGISALHHGLDPGDPADALDIPGVDDVKEAA